MEENVKYTDDLLELFSSVTRLPEWPEIKKFFYERLDGLAKGLQIPFVDVASGTHPEAYISAISLVQGQIRELRSLTSLFEMAEKVPKIIEESEE